MYYTLHIKGFWFKEGNVSEIMKLSSQSQINVLFEREDRLYNKIKEAASKIEMTKK